MKYALALAALSLFACGDETDCPAIAYVDGFSLVLDDGDWNAADYVIEVSYQDGADMFSFRCDVSVPALAGDGAIDGGVSMAPSADGGLTSGIPAPSSCTNLIPTGRAAYVTVGQALVLSFEGTPPSARVRITREGGVLVSDRELTLSYETTHPHGRQCGGPTRAEALSFIE